MSLYIDDILFDYTAPNSGKINIKSLACLGDSLTDAEWLGIPAGSYYKVPNPKDHWTRILERELVIPVFNHGIAGDTSLNIATSVTRVTNVIADKPTHCTLMIGGNDIYAGQTGMQIMDNIDIIVKKLQTAGIIVILMWCNIGTLSTSSVDIATQKSRIAEMPGRYQTYATANGLTFINLLNTTLYNGDVVPAYYLPDKIHINTTGHPIMATYILQQLGAL